MSLDLPLPIIYLITSGQTTSKTTPKSPEFSTILRLVEAAVASNVSLVQLREKNLSARVLYDLTLTAVGITGNSSTRLIVNDRFDIAMGAHADGVHLTSRSMSPDVVRKSCGPEFLIGASTHSLSEARLARDRGADFVVFGPVFETESKRAYGAPQGLVKLREVSSDLNGFPVVAIGGMKVENARECFQSGAAGVAAISLLSDAAKLKSVVDEIDHAH
ncbi:MAG TPA: thiamine phosphate synthase [Pyrinomonadaceae bacterium]|jgi:Thiamine monophosphate synthase|nr:thiamine phosphate synthase [Pyrinomonadaceae bacterium]